MQKIKLPFILKKPILACGAELKSSFCLAKNNTAFLSDPLGDLENLETLKSFENKIRFYKKSLNINPEVIVYDLHPEYLSTKYALGIKDSKKLIGIQHHHAHIASCMVENNLKGKVIGVVFDGTGFGDDARLWGSEFMIADTFNYRRKAHLEYIPLIGGNLAIKEPWRVAASLLYQIYKDKILSLKIDFIKRLDKNKWAVLKKMLLNNINTPLSCGMGRLFDAVSSLIGIRDTINYEAQAAIELEKAIGKHFSLIVKPYNYRIEKNNELIIKVKPIIIEIVKDIKKGVPKSEISLRFHYTVAKIIGDMCRRLRRETGINKVVLTGGVFQNKALLKVALPLLQKEDFLIFQHKTVSTTDASVALGQLVIAASRIKRG